MRRGQLGGCCLWDGCLRSISHETKDVFCNIPLRAPGIGGRLGLLGHERRREEPQHQGAELEARVGIAWARVKLVDEMSGVVLHWVAKSVMSEVNDVQAGS